MGSEARAWVSVSYDQPQAPQAVSPEAVQIHFTIRNFGKTTARITSILTHFYLPKIYGRDWPFSKDPRPDNKNDDRYLSDSQWADTQKEQHFMWVENGTDTYDLLAGQEIKSISQTFFYKGRQLLQKDMGGDWFLCVIKYDDVYGFHRETSYFAYIAGAIALVKPSKYNF